jgi:hypothetical protein
MDLNHNGEPDVLKLRLLSLGALGTPAVKILPGGKVAVHDLSLEVMLDGAVADASVDPPFGPFTLLGPTTGRSTIVGGAVPEGTSAGFLTVFLGLSTVAGGALRRRVSGARA